VQGEQPSLAEQFRDRQAVLVPSDETGHRQRQRRPAGRLGPAVRRRQCVPQDVLLDAVQGR
jgi:hypothetical protein